jgi:hypothetical protein
LLLLLLMQVPQPPSLLLLLLLLLLNDAVAGPCINILAHLGQCPDLILQQKGKHKHTHTASIQPLRICIFSFWTMRHQPIAQ